VTYRLEEGGHLVDGLTVLLAQELQLGGQLAGVNARQHGQQLAQGGLGDGGDGLDSMTAAPGTERNSSTTETGC